MIKSSSAVRRRSFLLPVFVFADNLKLKKTKTIRNINLTGQDYWEDKWVNKFTEDGAEPGGFVVETEAFLRRRGLRTVLDLGSGKGRGSLWLSAKGYEVTALDISPSALAYIHSLNPRVKTICTDIAAFKGSGLCFDWVLADLSLHYWDDTTTRMIIAEIYKALVPGGCFSIACKSVADFEYGQGRKIAADTFEHGHIRHFFSLDYMRELLREFEIEKTAETERREKHYGHYRTVEAVAFKPK